MRDFLITGTILAEQPLAYSPPDCQNAKHVSLFPRMAVMADGTLKRRPYIGSGALRGVLRRAASDVMRDKIGVPVSFATALEWRIGGAKSSGEVNASPERRTQVIRDNVILALFGAGSSEVGFIGGKLSVDHLIPPIDIIPDVVPAARRAEEKTEAFLNMLTPEAYDQVVAWGSVNTARSRARARADRAAVKAAKLKGAGNSAERAAAEAEAKAAKDELTGIEAEAQALGGDVSIGMPLPGYEILPQGLEFQMSFRLTAATDIEAGLFLAGLERFAVNPYVGAHRATGCGQISGRFAVMARDGFTAHAPIGGLSFHEMKGLQCDAEVRALINGFHAAKLSLDHVRGAALMPSAVKQAEIIATFKAMTGHPPRPSQDRYAFRVADVCDLPPPEADAPTVRVTADTGLGKARGYLVPLALRAVEHDETYLVATYSIKLLRQLVEVEMPVVAKAVRAVTGRSIAYGEKLGRGQFADPERIDAVIVRLQQTLVTRRQAGAKAAEIDGLAEATMVMQAWRRFAADPHSSGLIVEAMEDTMLDLWLPADVSTEDFCLTPLSDPDAAWSDKYRRQIERIAGGARLLFVTHASVIIDCFRDGNGLLLAEGVRGVVLDEAERVLDAAEGMQTYRQTLAELHAIVARTPHIPPALLDTVTASAHQLLASTPPSFTGTPAAALIDLDDMAHRRLVVEVERLVLAVEQLPPSQVPDLDAVAGLRRWLRAAAALPVGGQRPLIRAAVEPVVLPGNPPTYGPALVATSRAPARIMTRLWRGAENDAPLVDFVVLTSATISPPVVAGLGARSHPLDADFVVSFPFGRLRFFLAGDAPVPFVKVAPAAPALNPEWVTMVAERIDEARQMASPNQPTRHRGAARVNRVLVLCASYEEAALLGSLLSPPPLVHAHGVPLDVMLDRFRADPEACLLTPVAWEGVDLPDLIDQLVIPRVPFAPPALTRDALMAEAFGQSAFGQSGHPGQADPRSGHGYPIYLNIDRAIARLKQGIGRVIRSPSWRGHVWILDARMPVHVAVRHDPLRRGVHSPAAMAVLSAAIPARFSRGIASAYEHAVILSEISLQDAVARAAGGASGRSRRATAEV